MRSGTENKRQICLLAALCVVIIAIAAFEFHGAFESKPNSHAATVPRTSTAACRDELLDWARQMSP